MGKSSNGPSNKKFRGSGQRKSKAKMYYQKEARTGHSGGNSSGSGTFPQKFRKLVPGMAGFLCTTNFNEKHAVKEAYNLLNEYHNDEDNPVISTHLEGSGSNKNNVSATSEDQINASSDPPQESATNVQKETHEDDDDVESAMAAEVNDLKRPEVKYKFQSVDTGVPNLIFISALISNPVLLAEKIFKDISEKAQQKSRYLLRMIPIQATCKANLADIKSTAEKILPPYFKSGYNSFQVVYKSRYNDSMNRLEVIKIIADVAMQLNTFNSVNLKQPKFSIVVEILRNLCCIGVLTNFVEFRKYNLIEAASSQTKSNTSTTAETKDSNTSGTENAAVVSQTPTEPDAEIIRSNSQVESQVHDVDEENSPQ